jgi:hypothetical protein
LGEFSNFGTNTDAQLFIQNNSILRHQVRQSSKQELMHTLMKRVLSIPPILFQVFITFLTLYIIFILFFVSKTNEKAGVVEGLGFENSRTFYALMTITFTIVICLLIELPIRIVSTVHTWWTHRPIINILAFLCGLSMIFLYSNSFFSHETTHTSLGVATSFELADPHIILTGWFLVGFSLLHLYPISCCKLKNKNQI